MISKSAVVALGLAAATFALPAAAQFRATGFYVGASIGQSSAKDFCDSFSGIPNLNCDDKDTAWKIFAGYQFHPNIAAEFGYTDLGKAKASDPTGEISDEATAWELTALGSWPIANQFSIYGRFGFYHGEVKTTASAFGFGSASDDKTTTDITYGLGARFDVTRNIGLRLEWQRYADMKDALDGKSNVDVFSIGALYRFQ